MLAADHWDPGNVTLSKVSRTIEENEMRTICSLTSGLSKKELEAMSSAEGLNSAGSQLSETAEKVITLQTEQKINSEINLVDLNVSSTLVGLRSTRLLRVPVGLGLPPGYVASSPNTT